MIIFGTKTVHIKSKQSPTLTCLHCGTKGSIVLSVFRKHAHVFWIPFFPLWKKVFSQCQHCKNTLYYCEPTDLKKESDTVKNDARGPVWQFAGLAIILAIAWSVFLSA